MLNDYWLKMQIGNNAEFDVNSITSNLHFIELTTQPAFANSYQTIAGIDGSFYTTSQFNKTTVNLKFLIEFNSWRDLDLAKHDIYHTFMTKDVVRIRCDTAPNKVYYCRAMPFQIAPNKVGAGGAVFTVPLDNPTGMCYSICNSDEINNLDKNSNWSYGMNIPNNKSLQYHFANTNEFNIYNASDKSINPYLQNDKLAIQIRFSGSYLQITNKTNGSSWKYNNNSDGNSTILLNGVESSLNGQPCTQNTDYGHIVLNKGDNDIVLNGANSSDIIFSFPFVYLA